MKTYPAFFVGLLLTACGLSATPISVQGHAHLASDFPDIRTYFETSIWGDGLSLDATGASYGIGPVFAGGTYGVSASCCTYYGAASIGDVRSSRFQFAVGTSEGYLTLFDSSDQILASAVLAPVYLRWEERVRYGYDWGQNVSILSNPEPGTFLLGSGGVLTGTFAVLRRRKIT